MLVWFAEDFDRGWHGWCGWAIFDPCHPEIRGYIGWGNRIRRMGSAA